VNADDFASRQEYTSPLINFKIGDSASDSFSFVANVKKAGVNGPLNLVGGIYYRGDWHIYNAAIFKGGDTAPFISTSREVVSCRYGCSYNEGFQISLSPADILKHTQDGAVAIQIRSQRSSDDPIIEIPRTFIDAVIEVSKCEACKPIPPAETSVREQRRKVTPSTKPTKKSSKSLR
jgi:hypothetical protein